MASVHEYWADRMADDIIARVEADPFLKNIVKKTGYFVYDEKTPSGDIHIGSGRGWVIHDVLAKALREKGKDARFVLSSDDYDPFDKPINGKPEYDQYLGMPFKNIPSPVEGYESFADYYFTQVTTKFPEWGLTVELASTGEDYQNGIFNAAIKTALDNYQQIQKIFERIYDKPYEKIPFNPICESCGKIATTTVTAWDPEKDVITYECKDGIVTWANGCGHTGTMSPYNGNGKLPWKVEWAAKWPSKNVIVETAGKDHFTKGGSRTVSIAISAEVFQYPPPWPSTATEEGPGYEFFNLGGKKMSTSRGLGVSFAGVTDHVPAKILRFLMVSYKPTSVIDFDPARKDDLLLLYDRYDHAERVYFEKEDDDRTVELSRTYVFAQTGPLLTEFPPQIGLRHAGVVVQIARDDAEAIRLLQADGELPTTLSDEHVAYLAERFAAARSWLREFAPEREKFSVQETVTQDVKGQLSSGQKNALALLAAKLGHHEYDSLSLFQEFYKICEEAGIPNTEFFTGAYLVLLGKTQGPKLANLILILGKDRVTKLFTQV